MELVFESSLTMEEIEAAFSSADLFAGVMEGLQDALSTCHMTKTVSSQNRLRKGNATKEGC